MLCRNCGEETKGKFCSNCGHPLNAEVDTNDNVNDVVSEMDGDNSFEDICNELTKEGIDVEVEDEEFELIDFKEEKEPIPNHYVTVKKKVVNEKRRRPRRFKKVKIKKVHRKREKMPKRRSVFYVPKGIISLVRYVSIIFLIMATALIIRQFWIQKHLLGNWKLAFEEYNYAFAVYGAAAALTFIYGVVNILWVLLRRKLPDGNKFIKVDTGRGLTAFIMLALVVFICVWIESILPDLEGVWKGLLASIQVYVSLKKPLLWISMLGCLTCIGRKVLSR